MPPPSVVWPSRFALLPLSRLGPRFATIPSLFSPIPVTPADLAAAAAEASRRGVEKVCPASHAIYALAPSEVLRRLEVSNVAAPLTEGSTDRGAAGKQSLWSESWHTAKARVASTTAAAVVVVSVDAGAMAHPLPTENSVVADPRSPELSAPLRALPLPWGVDLAAPAAHAVDWLLLQDPAARMRTVVGASLCAVTIGARVVRFELPPAMAASPLAAAIHAAAKVYRSLNPSLPPDLRYEVVPSTDPAISAEPRTDGARLVAPARAFSIVPGLTYGDGATVLRSSGGVGVMTVTVAALASSGAPSAGDRTHSCGGAPNHGGPPPSVFLLEYSHLTSLWSVATESVAVATNTSIGERKIARLVASLPFSSDAVPFSGAETGPQTVTSSPVVDDPTLMLPSGSAIVISI